MIIVKLVGGLGNQMFEYAAGRRLAHLHGTTLKLDTAYLLDRRPRPDVVFRDFDLPIFNYKAELASSTECAHFTGRYKSRIRIYGHRILSAINPPNIVVEKHFHFDPSLLEEKKDAYLQGYWQSEKYFKDIEDIIRNDFTFRQPLQGATQELALQIQSTNAVCLNVRRGDFVTNSASKQTLGFVGKEYYQKAIAYLLEKVSDPEFFIFSDDITWCRENIHTGFKTTFVDHTYAGEKFSDYLQLITLCKHYIIPNSTFAWWGAWLSANTSKLVITPYKWFNNATMDAKDLIPAAWVRL
jgi:hypothetical protein